jgi:hypothetical protein
MTVAGKTGQHRSNERVGTATRGMSARGAA